MAKSLFPQHGVDEHGNIAVQMRVTRSKLLEVVAQFPACILIDDKPKALRGLDQKESRLVEEVVHLLA